MYVVHPSEFMLLINMDSILVWAGQWLCVCVSGKVGGLCKYQMLLIIGKMQTLVKSLLVHTTVSRIDWDGPLLGRGLVSKAAVLSLHPSDGGR